MKRIQSFIVCFLFLWLCLPAPAQINLIEYEYWFNHSYNSKQQVGITNGAEHHFTETIDVSALPDGVNVLNIRVKDENKLYSSTLSKVFYKIPNTQLPGKNLSTYELWFNNDYETRQINSLDSHSEQHILAEIDVSDLPVGVHVVNMRFKDANNLYTSTLSKVFYKMEQDFFSETKLSAYKYWFDEDYENAVFIRLQTPVKQFGILDDFNVIHLPLGEHTVHFQFLDEKGKWSVIKSDVFTKTAIPEAMFSVNNETACANSPVLFMNESNDADSFSWDFGDGNTSDVFEPEHIYAEAGEYLVVLTAIDLASGRENEMSQLIVVDDCIEVCTNLMFNPGWNLFSVPADPENTDLKNLFQPLIDYGSLVKIQDEQGNALEDWGMMGGWRNFIGDISPTEGYKIRIVSEDELEVCGLPVDYPFAIPLSAGWNIIGFPHTASTNGMDIIQPLIDKGSLQKVQDETGNAIEDWGMMGGWRNFIGEFSPGKGFKIKLASDDTLLIQEAYPKSTAQFPETVPASYFKPGFTGNGVDHMNINVSSLPANKLQSGDELAVFDGEICVGAKKLQPHHFARQVISIPVSAKDQYGMPGFSEGNTITLKLWSSAKNKEFLLEPEILKGTSTFMKHESTLMSLEKLAVTGLDYEPGKNKPELYCYPNPFSNEITIEVTLAEDTEVQVEIFNQLGQKVKILTPKQFLTTGRHPLVWDGKNVQNQKISPGIYFVRFLTGNFQLYEKIILSE